MKIISKYKDFYDFLTVDHDADTVYVRKPYIVLDNYDKLYCHDLNKWDSSKNVPGIYDWNRVMKAGEVYLLNYIFGIYPTVYSQPVLVMTLPFLTGGKESYCITLSREWCEMYALLKNNKDRAKMKVDLANKKHKEIMKKNDVVKFDPDFRPWNDQKMTAYLWKEDCPEIFMKIGAPIFIKYDKSLLGTTYGSAEYLNSFEKVGSGRHYEYMANICFNKLDNNILKAWFDEVNNLNTYINIENFLWASKKEPESEPDNKTKIINHGFDLKTSFRNM